MRKLIKLGLICIASTFASGCVQNLSDHDSSIFNPPASGLQTNNTEKTSESEEIIILTLNPDGGFLNDSSELQEVEYKKDETLTLPIPRKAAFSFDGWFDGDTRVTDNQGKISDGWMPTSSVTLVAQYVTAKNITLAFHYEGK